MEKNEKVEVDLQSKKIELIEISKLKCYEKNPRVHSEKQLLKIMQSIKRYGYTNPILIDKDEMIIAGAARLEAMKKLGAENIPAIRLENLTKEEVRAYRLADNRIAEDSHWDKDLLKIEIKEILNLDFEILDTGFETPEIDDLIFEPFTEKNKEDDEKLPKFIDIPARVVKGDIWTLGSHTLVCMDALETETYQLLLKGSKANLVITDPPYNVKIKGHVCGNGKTKHENFVMATGEMNDTQFFEFTAKFMKNLRNFSEDGSLHYLFIDWRSIKTFLNAGEQYDELKNICVWDKTIGGMGSLYRSQHELVCLFKNGKKPHTNNVQLGSNGRYRTNVWSVRGMSPINPQATELFMLHPTVKPTSILQDIILDVSKPNDIVLDCFGGSGSTLIACEKTKRKAHLVELDPKYCDATIFRWEKLTGQEASFLVNIGGGRNV